MGLMSKTLIAMVFLIVFNAELYAAWQGPATVMSGAWGAADDQFGIEYGDTNDMFAGPFYLLPDGSIIIRDVLNARYKVYNGDGSIKKVLKCKEITPAVYNEECNFTGNYLQVTTDGNVWIDLSKYKNPKYALYSPTGQLIQTYTSRPPELGAVFQKTLSSTTAKITVQYPDKTWSYTDVGRMSSYMRDTNGNLYGYGNTQVIRYTTCGRQAASLMMPKKIVQETSRGPQIDPQVTVLEEYGSPVIAPNGDVYTWKRTPTAYSILKWAWVNDPNAPANAPDVPDGFSLKTTTTGINLFWKAVPQDPGCLTGYELARSTTTGGPYSTLATVGAGTANATGWIKYADATAEVGTTYYYKVRAVAGPEYSPYTAEVLGKR